MAPVTQITLLPLIEGNSFDDDHSPAGQTFKECVDVLLAQKGVQKCYWGREVENPSMMRLFVDWDSVFDHKAFLHSDVFRPFRDRLSTLLSSDIVSYHAHFAPQTPTAALGNIKSLVTEVITIYFPTSYTSEDQKTFEDDLRKLTTAFEEDPEGSQASTGGWVEEDLPIPGSSEKAKAYVGCVGWVSIEAHAAFRGTQTFKDNVSFLRGAKDLKALSMTHVQFKEA